MNETKLMLIELDRYIDEVSSNLKRKVRDILKQKEKENGRPNNKFNNT